MGEDNMKNLQMFATLKRVIEEFEMDDDDTIYVVGIRIFDGGKQKRPKNIPIL